VAAANTEKVVNSEKGQFMSPESMKHAVQKKCWIAIIQM
jgi:2-dehydro-3-deoxyphosphooctonate aldolase (KDO 8-P synthase)